MFPGKISFIIVARYTRFLLIKILPSIVILFRKYEASRNLHVSYVTAALVCTNIPYDYYTDRSGGGTSAELEFGLWLIFSIGPTSAYNFVSYKVKAMYTILLRFFRQIVLFNVVLCLFFTLEPYFWVLFYL